MSDTEQPRDTGRLKRLLDDSGTKSFRFTAAERVMGFRGRTRDWTLVAQVSNDWLCVYSYVCEIPTATLLQAKLLEAALEANDKMSLTKFSKQADGLHLEMQHRIEHVDAETIGRLLGLFVANCEEHYPRLFRIVSGDMVLEALGNGAVPAVA